MSESEKKIQPRYLILLPAYNEEKYLKAVIDAVKKQNEDILVIDDGSSDQTLKIAQDEGVHVLSRGYNMGKGQSLKDGYQWALENGYDAVIMLDSDGQHKPEEIPLFKEKYQSGNFKLIIGARDYSKIPLRRRIPNAIGKWLFSLGVGQTIPDNQSGFRLLDRDMMELVLKSPEKGFQFEVEMIARCIGMNWPIGWVPISTIYFNKGKSHQRVFDQLFGFPKAVMNARRIIQEERNK